MKKPFDAVAMKRRGSEEVYDKVRNMTPEEEAAFWREKTEELCQIQAARSQHRKLRPAV
jgi:hypothetical protein